MPNEHAGSMFIASVMQCLKHQPLDDLAMVSERSRVISICLHVFSSYQRANDRPRVSETNEAGT